ncbi:hypothetical protein GGX14DRAFT_564268 [Mycena pura]|uniref:Uncharacterized protein n=1 Tax=Mycena pura TaxID=153505 RepID=A0AAD6VKJ5_9AGAR|nr:hypothetical protein GGX14DRAFT_564268 [Mycena pura]
MPDRPNAVFLYSNLLFVGQGKPFTTDDISNVMVCETIDILGCEVDTEDSNANFNAQQAGHSKGLEDQFYGLSQHALAGIPEDLLFPFMHVSIDYQMLIKVVPGRLGLNRIDTVCRAHRPCARQPPLSQCDDTHGAALAPPTAARCLPLSALARTGQDSLFQTRWLRCTGTGILSARTLHHTPLMLVRACAHHTQFLLPALARKPHTLKFVCHTRAEPPRLPPPPPILKMPSPHTAPRHRAAAALLAALSMTRLACHAVPPVAHPPLESAHMLAGWLLDSLINFPSTIRRT